MSIRWHRTWMTVGETSLVLRLVYHTEDQDWSGWSIDRIPMNAFTWEYQVKLHDSPIGVQQLTLHAAKMLVERSGRPVQSVETTSPLL